MALRETIRKLWARWLTIRELEREPPDLEYYREVNEIVRSLSHLVARHGDTSLMVRCDADGKLEIVGTGTGAALTTLPYILTVPPSSFDGWSLDTGVGAEADLGSAASRIMRVSTEAESLRVCERVTTGGDLTYLGMASYAAPLVTHIAQRYYYAQNTDATTRYVYFTFFDL